MTKEQETQMNDYYLELLKNGTIKTLNEAMIFKLSYEKAFSLNGVVKSFYCGVKKRQEGEICESQCGGCAYKEAIDKQ
jgi:hypothetical protein